MSSFARAARSIDADVLSVPERTRAIAAIRADLARRQEEANRRDAALWARVSNRDEWEAFSRPSLTALRRSLGAPVADSAPPETHVTRVTEAEGYAIENLIYESRSGVSVTANLYCPTPGARPAPAIVIVHSHHNAKDQGELQDMGVTWARGGCHVLVMDQLGYGERRYHTPGPRQDYRFRYMTAAQLHVIGESLMGWMVHDIRRGIDMLLTRDAVDPGAIILMGAVAGGGDPAAVAAALDERVSCAIPFNFGGPQPETQYPLPEDAEATFNYMGHGSWESTRNLRLSARDGFLPWTIVASIAPRRLIYAHEFAWDREHDPVWNRLRRVYGFYDAEDRLSYTHGAGVLTGSPPEATHCNQVGVAHRRMIHEALNRWYGIAMPDETQQRRDEAELTCLTDEMRDRLRARPAYEVFGRLGRERLAAARAGLAALTPARRVARLQRDWTTLLGDTEPSDLLNLQAADGPDVDGVRIRREAMRTPHSAQLTTLTLTPPESTGRAVVLCVAQQGKQGFLAHRADEIADLLARDIAVCLADLPMTGELQPNADRTWRGATTSMSATEWMLGGSLLGTKLRAMRGLARHLRATWASVGVWGDSFSPRNPPEWVEPLIGEGAEPHLSEPAGGLLAALAALYEPHVRCVVARGMLTGYAALLDHAHCHIPHDALVPGVLTAGDIPDLVEALHPRPTLVDRSVDGRNRAVATQAPDADIAAWVDAHVGRRS